MREEAAEAVRGGATNSAKDAATGVAGTGTGGLLGNITDGLLKGSGRKDSILETVANSAARTTG